MSVDRLVAIAIASAIAWTSGCAAPPPPKAALPQVDPEDDALRFTAPQRVGVGVEPSIAIRSDGTVFVAALTTTNLLPWAFWSSRDGSNFTVVELGSPVDASAGLDVDVAVNDRHLYLVDLSVACVTLHARHSMPGMSGENRSYWTSNPLSCAKPLADRPWVTTDGAERVWIAHRNLASPTLHVSRSTDAGLSFLNFTAPLEGGEDCSGNPPSEGKLVYVPRTDRLFLASCNDSRAGLQWTNASLKRAEWRWQGPMQQAATSEGGTCPVCHRFLSADATDDGTVYLAWSAASSQSLDVWFAARRPDGTWTDASKVNRGPGTHVMPWVAAGTGSRVAVFWYAMDETGGTTGKEGRWYVRGAMVRAPDGERPAFVPLMIDPDPVHDGTLCLLGPTSCSSASMALREFFEADVGPDGRFHVAYTDAWDGTRRLDEKLISYVRSNPG